jgi:hypothetical protein
MTWTYDGSRNDDDWGEHHPETQGEYESIRSALDRYNLVTMIDAYTSDKKALLERIVMAGAERCTLSAPRLARDCSLGRSTVFRHCAAFIADGILSATVTTDGKPALLINWLVIVELAMRGLTHRPADERVRIIGIFDRICTQNVLPIDERWLEAWSDPAAKPLVPRPGEVPAKRQRARNSNAIRRLSGAARRKLAKNTHSATVNSSGNTHSAGVNHGSVNGHAESGGASPSVSVPPSQRKRAPRGGQSQRKRAPGGASPSHPCPFPTFQWVAAPNPNLLLTRISITRRLTNAWPSARRAPIASGNPTPH